MLMLALLFWAITVCHFGPELARYLARYGPLLAGWLNTLCTLAFNSPNIVDIKGRLSVFTQKKKPTNLDTSGNIVKD